MPFLTDYPQLQIVKDIAKIRRVKVYLVGGFVRDFLINRKCLDFDFAVEKGAVTFAHVFAKEIKGAFVLLDEDHGCARVVKKKSGEISTFDFADYRAPTINKDLLHRDFTINTFCIEINNLNKSSEIQDVILDLKKGKRDLNNKRIRMVSVKTFKEDPLRLMRAFSQRALLGFTIEKRTIDQIKEDASLIRTVAYERIRDELFKILGSDRAAVNIKMMDRIRLLEKIIPQITVMYGVKQGTYHHLDVWPHSLETVVQVEKLFKEMKNDEDIKNYLDESVGGDRTRRALIKLAALLHDVGKPDTRKKEVGKLTFHGHERVGKTIVNNVAKLLKLSTKERISLGSMVFCHLRPGYLSNFKKPSDRAIFRFFRNTKEDAIGVLLLSLADQRATRGPLTTEEDQKHHERICRALMCKYFEKLKEKPFVRIINGTDLIKKLKLHPSPLFAKILNEVEEKQATGKIKTKEEALELAKRILANTKTIK